MPVCTVTLLSLTPQTTIPTFLSALRSTPLKPLIISRVIRWIILPSTISTSELLAKNIHWDILLILPSSPSPSPFPTTLQPHISHTFTLSTGIPSRLLIDFPQKNQQLLHPSPSSIPALTGSLNQPLISTSTQGLELSPELQQWISTFSTTPDGAGAVSMLNLLSFNPGMKDSYLKYGAEFAKSIGSSRGGNAKIVGNIIHPDPKEGAKKDDGEGWDEMALAHYPSILHFADMLASEDYQVVNQRYRVPSLRDTLILCTSELGLDLDEGGKGEGRAKL